MQEAPQTKDEVNPLETLLFVKSRTHPGIPTNPLLLLPIPPLLHALFAPRIGKRTLSPPSFRLLFM